MDTVSGLVSEPQGDALRPALDATLRELARFGITGASEAGDYTDEAGIGPDAALGDSYSTLTDLGDLVDGRLRLTLGIPVDALAAASASGLRTGVALNGRRTMRFGGPRSTRTVPLDPGRPRCLRRRPAAMATRASCASPPVSSSGCSASRARPASGSRSTPSAIGRPHPCSTPWRPRPRRAGTPEDRMEHAQLLRAEDLPRFAELGMTASFQPIHAAADRDLVEACWADRQHGAYAWRGLRDAGARLAAGSDAPYEAADPWLGMFAAVHRRLPTDERPDWHPDQALTISEALMAYTQGPAQAIGADDEGHLRAGARADLAVLDVDLETLLDAGEPMSGARSVMTIVDGAEVPLG